MRASKAGCAIALATALFGTTGVQAQTPMDLGKRVYEANCAGCHGLSGRGHGSYERFLSVKAPDLTLIARNNGGVFPVTRIYEVIEGPAGGETGAHGSREMPIWGNAFRAQPDATYVGVSAQDTELHVRTRILALIEYLSRLQSK